MREPPCNQGMLASVVFQCQRLHLVTSDAELQSNGVNDGGTTESRGLHGWIGGASKFTMPFTLLEYVVRVAKNIRSKFSEFSIDCKFTQNGAGMYPGSNFTSNEIPYRFTWKGPLIAFSLARQIFIARNVRMRSMHKREFIARARRQPPRHMDYMCFLLCVQKITWSS